MRKDFVQKRPRKAPTERVSPTPGIATGSTREGVGTVSPAAFADASKTVGLLAAPQPGSVAPELFHSEKTIPGPPPPSISTGLNAVLDTSRSSIENAIDGERKQSSDICCFRQAKSTSIEKQSSYEKRTKRQPEFPLRENRARDGRRFTGQARPSLTRKTYKSSWLIHKAHRKFLTRNPDRRFPLIHQAGRISLAGKADKISPAIHGKT